MSVTTSGFSAFGFVFLGASAAFFVRLPACFFVGHNSCPFFCYPFPGFASTLGAGADFEVMLIHRRESKRRVEPYRC
jgi:hypothetical protein